MKKFIFLCLFGLSVFNKISAQSPIPEIVYIRVHEPLKITSGAFDAVMVIIKPDNTSETVALKKPGAGGNSLDENGVIVKNEISKWLANGFKIITINSSGGDYISRTEIFLKKE